MTPESSPGRANGVGPPISRPEALNAHQRALFIGSLLEAGFEMGQMVRLDDETISRILGGMEGMRAALVPRWW
jgi:hypothetical protein